MAACGCERSTWTGDRQADLSVHGGPDKAIYVYPSEHYDYWQGEFPDMELPWGMFGENFTTTGLLEGEVNVGDTVSHRVRDGYGDAATCAVLQAGGQIWARGYRQAVSGQRTFRLLSESRARRGGRERGMRSS